MKWFWITAAVIAVICIVQAPDSSAAHVNNFFGSLATFTEALGNDRGAQ